jgi:hypothetical protein
VIEASPSSAVRATRSIGWSKLWRSPALLCWCLFLLLVPVYVLPVGLPQPADLLLFALAPMAFFGWNRRLDRRTSRAVRALFWFTVWVAVVNYAWAFALWKWTSRKDFVVHPLYYLFNFLMFLSAILIARIDRVLFLRATLRIVLFTISVLVIASFFYSTNLYRGALFFDSPNQLGYFALLCACLFAMTPANMGLPRLWSAIGVSLCAYLAVLSASRASLAGIFVLLFLLVFSNPRTIIIGSLVALALMSVGGPLANAIDASENRITHDRFSQLTFSEERGYDRLWRFPEYLPLGAGEGGYDRFMNEGEARREIHSSFASILFGYGIVGIALFGVFFVRVIRGAPLRNTLMIVPALVYTVAHQGLRFTMFWIVLAVFVVLKEQGSPEKP